MKDNLVFTATYNEVENIENLERKVTDFFVILREDCRWPRKLFFETELYESLF